MYNNTMESWILLENKGIILPNELIRHLLHKIYKTMKSIQSDYFSKHKCFICHLV